MRKILSKMLSTTKGELVLESPQAQEICDRFRGGVKLTTRLTTSDGIGFDYSMQIFCARITGSVFPNYQRYKIHVEDVSATELN